MGEQPQRGAALRIDQAQQRGAFVVALPGAICFEAEEFADAKCGFVAAEIFRRDAVALKVFFRKVNAAQGVVCLLYTSRCV